MDRDINQLLAVVELAGDIVGCLQLSFIPGLSRLGAWRGQIDDLRIYCAVLTEAEIQNIDDGCD